MLANIAAGQIVDGHVNHGGHRPDGTQEQRVTGHLGSVRNFIACYLAVQGGYAGNVLKRVDDIDEVSK